MPIQQTREEEKRNHLRDKAICFTTEHCEGRVEYFWPCAEWGFLSQPFGLRWFFFVLFFNTGACGLVRGFREKGLRWSWCIPSALHWQWAILGLLYLPNKINCSPYNSQTRALVGNIHGSNLNVLHLTGIFSNDDLPPFSLSRTFVENILHQPAGISAKSPCYGKCQIYFR